MIDGEPVLDRPSATEVEAYVETADPDTRAVWLRLTRKGVDPASLSSDELADVEAAQADGRWDTPGPGPQLRSSLFLNPLVIDPTASESRARTMGAVGPDALATSTATVQVSREPVGVDSTT